MTQMSATDGAYLR